MKKLIALFCVASAVAAWAEEDSSNYNNAANVFGVLRVTLAANTKEAIISVPWLEPSTGTADIAVTNVIKTANLTAGDKLYYYDLSTQKYKVWQLKEDKTWEGAQSAGDAKTEAGSNQTLTRGNAILLKAGTASLPTAIYLYGQVAKTASVESTMAKGSATSPAYTLLAPPSASETSLNEGTWSDVSTGDYIIISANQIVNYDTTENKWGIKGDFNFETWQDTWNYDVKIPVGQGAWYVSVKNATKPAKVTWSNLPSVGE